MRRPNTGPAAVCYGPTQNRRKEAQKKNLSCLHTAALIITAKLCKYSLIITEILMSM